MAIDALQTVEIIAVMENFLEIKRPPEKIRHKVDLAYKIEGQSILIYEIRPRWDKPEELMESDIAKTTFVKSKQVWKIFWMRSDLKWHSYSPKPTVKQLKDFTALVAQDKSHCFFG
jgi:hypothetical protein